MTNLRDMHQDSMNCAVDGEQAVPQGYIVVSTVEKGQTQADHPGADQHPSDPQTNRCQNCETGREKSRDGGHEASRERTAKSAWSGMHKRQAPPDMLTGRSVQACLSREVPTDHDARGQRSGGCGKSRSADLC